ncbi:ATP-binding protein [Nonomuraea sp. NPDC050328]|uniref:ATP-binding protein n=1 Tax=Nonomuraea sp. NPDC050328 TaxID=3364361 RepID=UPI0037B51F6B
MSEVSEREAEVLAALGARLTNAEIARKLHISVRTVESHVSSLLRKYGAADRKALAALAGQTSPAGDTVTGLPAARSTFVGRSAERAAIAAAFTGSRLVTLLGPGGVGKTRLAIVTASGFTGGGAFVDLVPVRAGSVAQALASALGVIERTQQPLEDALAERLGSGQALLVLDNCEHVLDAVAPLVDRLLALCPGTRVLATSREHLGIPGERIVPIAPLPLSPASSSPASSSAASPSSPSSRAAEAASDAVLLFLDRARDADPGFDADPAVVAEICARLDGVPLAIELAAARSAALGPEGLLAALDDSLRLLSGGRGGDERHRSLAAVLGWSYDLLDEEERALFRRLSVFAGTFDLDAATALTGDRLAAVDGLARLTGKSLVVRSESRWRMLETVRAFAWAALGDDLPAVRAAHLGWAAGAAERLAGWPTGWREEFDLIADDLRTALTHPPTPHPTDSPHPGTQGTPALGNPTLGTAALGTPVQGSPTHPSPFPEEAGRRHRLARALGKLAYARRFLREARERFTQAAELAPTPAEAAKDLRSAASVALATAAAGDAFDLLLSAADQAEGTDRAILLSRAVVVARRHPGFGFESGVPYERLPLLEAEASELTAGATATAHLAGARAWTAGGEAAGHEAAEHAVATAQATGDPVLLSAALDALTMAHARKGELREAYRTAAERLALIDDMDRDDPESGIEIVDAFHSASSYALAAGDLPTALAVARRNLGDDLAGSHLAIALNKLIPPLVLMGEFDEALGHAAAMWERREWAGSRPGRWLAVSVYAVAMAYGLRGEEAQARSWRVRAAGLDRTADLVPFAAFADARVALHTGDFGQAAALVERGFAEFRPGRFERYAQATAAELAVAAGLPDAADRLAQAAPAALGSDWAAACLSRARGRLHGDRDELARSARAWERIGARFEQACTEDLLNLSGGAGV